MAMQDSQLAYQMVIKKREGEPAGLLGFENPSYLCKPLLQRQLFRPVTNCENDQGLRYIFRCRDHARIEVVGKAALHFAPVAFQFLPEKIVVDC